MKIVIAALYLIVGVIHLLPVMGVLGADRLTALYGIPMQENNLLILMQHRAVLFGLLGLLLVTAAFQPALQTVAAVGGLVSVVSFLVIAFAAGGYNEAIRTVVRMDIVALICLVLAVVLRGLAKN